MDSTNDRPPLITTGTYTLKLSMPEQDKVKVYEDGVGARLDFETAEGLCFSKNYGTKFGKSLAVLVGKISGKYVYELKANSTVPDFLNYLQPATNIYFQVEVEVTPDVEWQGPPRYKYKMNFPKGKGVAASVVPKSVDW